jgi:hypothetical protein
VDRGRVNGTLVSVGSVRVVEPHCTSCSRSRPARRVTSFESAALTLGLARVAANGTRSTTASDVRDLRLRSHFPIHESSLRSRASRARGFRAGTIGGREGILITNDAGGSPSSGATSPRSEAEHHAGAGRVRPGRCTTKVPFQAAPTITRLTYPLAAPAVSTGGRPCTHESSQD